jgi:hypothetical protein
MDATLIFSISIATVGVIGAAIFLIKRSKLDKPTIEHVANIHPNAGKIIDKALTSASDSVGHVTDTLNNLGNGIENIIKPLSCGVGDILHSIADRIGAKQKELNKLQLESIQQAQELERLKSRQINITNVTAQLKLALISVNQEYPSLIQESIETNKGMKTEYLGYFLAKYQVQLGVDIDKLQFQIVGDDRIRVFGLHEPIIVGMTNLKVEQKLSEMRKFTDKTFFFSAKSEILNDDNRLVKSNTDHTRKVLQEIQNNQSLEYLKKVNAQFALAFLQACLSSAGHKVEESYEPLSNPVGFGQLCIDINRNVASKIDFTSVKLVENDQKSKRIESEILAIASGS